jgi:hypothetical protein
MKNQLLLIKQSTQIKESQTQKLNFNKLKNLLIALAFILWIFSTDICNYFYPTNSEIDVIGFWETKKIIYSIIIFLLLVFIDKLKNFISIIFVAYVIEDVTDRLFGTKEFEWNDLLVLIITLTILTIKTYKNANSNKDNIFCINNLFRSKRNE